jgi:AcrR family transcriptional regulator
VSEQPEESGRPRQRRRTRKAIVAAAVELLARGGDPSVAEIADRADVSRRTVYMYFPTLEQLLTDATLGALTESAVGEAFDPALADDPRARLDALITALHRSSSETLPLGRRLIRLTVDAAASDASPKRGYRRIEWIEQALEPLRERLAPAEFDRLVSGIAMVVGWEALIVLRDIRGLDAEQELEVTLWSAHALLDSALAGLPTTG